MNEHSDHQELDEQSSKHREWNDEGVHLLATLQTQAIVLIFVWHNNK